MTGNWSLLIPPTPNDHAAAQARLQARGIVQTDSILPCTCGSWSHASAATSSFALTIVEIELTPCAEQRYGTQEARFATEGGNHHSKGSLRQSRSFLQLSHEKGAWSLFSVRGPSCLGGSGVRKGRRTLSVRLLRLHLSLVIEGDRKFVRRICLRKGGAAGHGHGQRPRDPVSVPCAEELPTVCRAGAWCGECRTQP